MRIAVAQISSFLGDLERNIDKHIEFCKEAIKNKANLIVFPELSLTGYSLKDINFEIAFNPYKTKKIEELKKISKEIDIICGFVEESESFAIYNSGMYISNGEILYVHRKIYPPTYGIFEEMRYFSSGKICKSFDTKYGRIGLLVCEDLWHLSLPYMLAMDGAQIIFTIAVSPTRLAADSEKFRNYEINCEHHKTYSRLLSLYLVFCNRVGYEDGVNFWGGSEIVNPFGDVKVVAKLFDEDLIFGDIDFNEIRQARHQARHFLDENLDLTIKNLKIIK